MAKTKLRLMPPNNDDFGNLLKIFGAQKKVVDLKSTYDDVDSESTDKAKSVDLQSTPQIVDSNSTQKSVDLKSTQKSVDLKSTSTPHSLCPPQTGVDSESTQEPVDLKSTLSTVDLKSTHKTVDSESTREAVDLESTPSLVWLSQDIDFYLIGVWQALFDTFGDTKSTVTMRTLSKKFSMDPSQFHRVLKRLELARMVRMESRRDATEIEILTPERENGR